MSESFVPDCERVLVALGRVHLRSCILIEVVFAFKKFAAETERFSGCRRKLGFNR